MTVHMKDTRNENQTLYPASAAMKIELQTLHHPQWKLNFKPRITRNENWSSDRAISRNENRTSDPASRVCTLPAMPELYLWMKYQIKNDWDKNANRRFYRYRYKKFPLQAWGSSNIMTLRGEESSCSNRQIAVIWGRAEGLWPNRHISFIVTEKV